MNKSGDIFKNKITICLFAFVLSVVLAVLLLVVAAFFPQDRIINNLYNSSGMLYHEGIYPSSSDYAPSTILDNFTDVIILQESAVMNGDNISTIMTNPLYSYNDGDVITCLILYLQGEQFTGVSYYIQYWMGFRAIMRIVLSFLNYFQIRRYLAAVFFLLFVAVICSLGKNCNLHVAFLFAISIVLVRPHVIVNSLQYSCCFLIMFIAMLLVPKIYRNPQMEQLYFMEIGIITMYFDFYTVPLITMGYPLIYLILMDFDNCRCNSYVRVFRNMISWFMGYGLMWLSKLTLTSILTSIDGLGIGFGSFLRRIGINKAPGYEEFYSVPLAFKRLKEVLLIDSSGETVLVICILLILLGIIYSFVQHKYDKASAVRAFPIFLLAVTPFAWFVITAQPIVIHYFFQYRSIALTYWGLLTYVYLVFFINLHKKCIIEKN